MVILFGNNLSMFNALEHFRKKESLSFAELGRRAGYTRATCLKHCKGEIPISGEAALRYYLRLGIPLERLRPDLFDTEGLASIE